MRCPLAPLALIVLCSSAHAQFSGRLAGTVHDASGAAVASATVSLAAPESSRALFFTLSASDGTYRFTGLRAGDYDLTVEAPGFARIRLTAIPVDSAREFDVPPVGLSLAKVIFTVDVAADQQANQTGTAEVSGIITMQQIEKLPVVDRDPLALLQIQPGVTYNGNSETVINGLRTSYSNMTLDGINIQDNYIRGNGLDYTPNRILTGQLRQVTLVSSNANAATPGGASQVVLETNSGTNELHGQAFWYNRNSAFAANDWFNNQSRVAIPRLNQNQFGGSAGGAIRKDKLFYFGSYEAVRTNQQSPTTATILTDDARSGIFTWRDTSNVIRKVNLLMLRAASIDPFILNLLKQVPGGTALNSFEVGDSTATLLRNTAGYRFNQRSNEVRDNLTGRADYNLSQRHILTTSYIWNRDNTDVYDPTFSVVPASNNPNHSHFLSAAWRWTPAATLTNELRGGFNLAPGDFLVNEPGRNAVVTGTLFTGPVSRQLPQGRATDTYSLADNASWQQGRHTIQFGVHYQKVRVQAFNDAGILPSYALAMGTGQPALQRADLPGSRAADVRSANSLLAALGGYIDSATRSFNVTSQTSGYVAGSGQHRDLSLAQVDLYGQDAWKPLRHLTVTLGLRWSLPGVVNEKNSLALSPVTGSAGVVDTLLSNATLDFTGASAGRAWYNRDLNNLTPNVGLAWDVTGNGRTALRAAYSVSYVNDEALLAPTTVLNINSGLTGVSSRSALSSRISSGLPVLAVPAFKIPRTVADNYAGDSFNAVGMINPNLRTPYVQQWSAGIQHEFFHTVVEARYIGNHAVGGYRTFDYNQVDIRRNGFLDDFLRAQTNGFLALAKNGTFNPAFNAAVPGSQQLPVFARLQSAGQLTDSTVRGYIQNGEVGTLAATYQEEGSNGSVNFFRNPNALGADLLTNYSSSSYNALQMEVRRRARAGIDVSANYTGAKVLSDTPGDAQSRIEHFLDLASPGLERAPATFDLRHAFKTAVTWDLPFGRNHWRRLAGGWSTGAFLTWQSGAPFSILSGLGTLNRGDGFRSYYNTANSNISGSALMDLVQFQMTGNGPYIIPQSSLNSSDGSGVSDPGAKFFSGQIFSNPGAGTLGTLGRRSFYGPSSYNLDMSVQKRIAITERQSMEVLIQGTNITNHPTFVVGDQNINDTTFGVVSSVLHASRVLQFGLHYRF